MSELAKFLLQQNNPFVVLLSFFMSCIIWWGVFVIESNIKNNDDINTRRWRLGQTLLVGFGIWAFHFIGMLGWQPGFNLYFDTTLTFTSLLISILAAYPLVSAFELNVPSLSAAVTLRVTGFAIGLGSMHYLGVFSAQTFPLPHWNTYWVIASLVLANLLGLSAVALNRWKSQVPAYKKRHARLLIAGVLGTLLFAVHYAGVFGASFEKGSICISTTAITPTTLATMVIVCGLIMVVSMIFISTIESRLESKLQEQNRNLKTKTELLEQLLHMDSVSSLPNRNALDQALRSLEKMHARQACLIKLQLVSYESLCDSWGQEFGNQVINLIKKRVADATLFASQIYRSAESEFEILTEQDMPEVTEYLNTLGRQVMQSFEIDGKTLSLGCYIGYAAAHSSGELMQLPAMARSACDYARRSSVNWLQFEPHMLKDTRDELDIQGRLRDAIGKSEFKLAYQPKIHAHTGELVGAEALMRWSTGDNQIISPARFIPIAEKYGLINLIGSFVLHQALSQQAEWIRTGVSVRLSINLSQYQLEQSNLVEYITQLLGLYQVPPDSICFEITESAAMLRPAITIEKLKKLRKIGVELSIDDFGTGYSSMSLLHKLPINELKIDRSFVQGLRTGSLPIIRATIQMAKDLRIRTVAEGIETEEEKTCLLACDVDELQGYLISKPMFGDEFQAYALHRKHR